MKTKKKVVRKKVAPKKAKTEKEIIKDIENEPGIGRIDLQESQDSVRDRLDDRIHMLLEKYGYGFKLMSFRWRDNNVPEAELILEKKPDIPLGG